MPVARHRTLGAILAASLLTACASPATNPIPSRPAVPDGWVRLTSPHRDVAVTVPPEVTTLPDEGGITAGYGDPNSTAGIWSLGLVAAGPTVLVPQPTSPFTEARLGDWLLGFRGGSPPETFALSSVRLPVGPAVELRYIYNEGTKDEVIVVDYAIPTAIGYAYLSANCQARPMSGCDDFIHLVPQLFEMNLGASSSPAS